MSGEIYGGPVFPCQPLDRQGYPICEMHPGMSLRDWFAGQALMGWAAGRNHSMDPEKSSMKAISISCYAYADAMLRAREKSQAPSASGASGGSCNPHDAASQYAGPVIFETNAKGPQ